MHETTVDVTMVIVLKNVNVFCMMDTFEYSYF